MRPRTNDSGLPLSVFEKHGAYYYVKKVDGKQKWLWLGRDRDAAVSRHGALATTGPMSAETLWKRLIRCLQTSRRRALAYGIDHDVTLEHLRELLEQQGGRCAVSGLAFTHERREEWKSSPYGPSIDRIDCTKGYVQGNVRIVCLCINYAMNEWGEDVLQAMLKALKPRRVLDRLRQSAEIQP